MAGEALKGGDSRDGPSARPTPGGEELPKSAPKHALAAFDGKGLHQKAFLLKIGDDILHRQITEVDDKSQSAYDYRFHVKCLLVF